MTPDTRTRELRDLIAADDSEQLAEGAPVAGEDERAELAELTRDEEQTVVVFRRWLLHPGWGILALFPGIDEGHGSCSSYEHVGQHGGASYAHCIARTVPATPAEYADLKAELEGLGYNLKVVKRRVRK